MDGMYVAADRACLESIAGGKVLKAINDLLAEQNKDRTGDEITALVAYEVRDSEQLITKISCLFESETGIKFRTYDYYNPNDTVDDILPGSLNFGTGIHEWYLNKFMELRQFYLDSRAVVLE